jgi:hypothetical protein
MGTCKILKKNISYSDATREPSPLKKPKIKEPEEFPTPVTV